MKMCFIVMRVPVGAKPIKLSIVSTAPDNPGDHLVALGDLLLDADVEVRRRGSLLGNRSLETFSTGVFARRHSVIYVLCIQQFVGHVQVPSVVDFV
jgi:hypothetical protein